MALLKQAAVIGLLFTSLSAALEFTIAGGQIFTPGLAVLNSPQPGTPLGGDLIEISLDITTNGRLPLPPYPPSSPSQIHNISIFLSSYTTNRNFTITNGTATSSNFNDNASLGNILLQEPGSTVKHVKWIWPDCLAGDGQPKTLDSARGAYNVSIRQSFRLNGEDFYTVFDVPISVTNRIGEEAPNGVARPSCEELGNELWEWEEIMEGQDDLGALFAPGDATVLETTGGDGDGDGLGPVRPGAGSGSGLGSGAGGLKAGLGWLMGLAMGVAVVVL
ncbi:hypothetical protein QBC40DRAFT_221842 [Triangularia verruculosa]|uniref:Uncharacterized protein n=1 Tax=Triangularia verruculosa TaxID=2587418 RepID=A0AAN7AX84_9PEZI|nr:hypothetical protein QBC40DRAFT_221842 [Triangularia verruculosa]